MKVSILLAAGEGTRMKSNTPKVLHRIAGYPMIGYVLSACRQAGSEKNILIVGRGGEEIGGMFEGEGNLFRTQPLGDGHPYGTGFAVRQALDDFDDEDEVLVITGDTPLIRPESLERLFEARRRHDDAAMVLSAIVDEPFGYGRILRGEDGHLTAIVEEKDASEKERAISEVNSGIFVFRGKDLRHALGKLETNNTQGELYLTDVIRILVEEGEKVSAITLRDNDEILGVNSKAQLAQCEAIMRQRINEEHMADGVIFIDPAHTVVERSVSIGRDTIIYPGAVLQGQTSIGEGCELYGTTRVVDSVIGDGVKLDNVLVEGSVIEDQTTLGPYAHVRPGSHIGRGVRIGNFVEVKNAVLGDGAKAGHLAYIGDADVGERVNVGCGVIFVNYDGEKKFRSVVEDDAFLGSNANLVAPVHVGERGYVAAGSTIVEDVEADSLAIGRGRQRNIDGWVTRTKEEKEQTR